MHMYAYFFKYLVNVATHDTSVSSGSKAVGEICNTHVYVIAQWC